MKKQLLKGILIALGVVSLSPTMQSCSAPKQALNDNDFEFQAKMAKTLKTVINNRYIEVGATGNAMTYNTAHDLAELNAKAKASRVFAEVLEERRALDIDNNMSDSKGGERSLSTNEVYDATVTSKSKSLIRNYEVLESYPGKSKDGTREKMMIVRIRVPLKKEVSKTLLTEASDESIK